MHTSSTEIRSLSDRELENVSGAAILEAVAAGLAVKAGGWLWGKYGDDIQDAAGDAVDAIGDFFKNLF